MVFTSTHQAIAHILSDEKPGLTVSEDRQLVQLVLDNEVLRTRLLDYSNYYSDPVVEARRALSNFFEAGCMGYQDSEDLAYFCLKTLEQTELLKRHQQLTAQRNQITDDIAEVEKALSSNRQSFI